MSDNFYPSVVGGDTNNGKDNTGLLIAEIELESEDESFSIASWIGQEVTGEDKYYNSNLTIEPYKNWNTK